MEFRDQILEEARKGNVVFSTIQGYAVASLEDFLDQPADGILYDLNRLPEVVMTFLDDPKWVNDYAVGLVIKALKERLEEYESREPFFPDEIIPPSEEKTGCDGSAMDELK